MSPPSRRAPLARRPRRRRFLLHTVLVTIGFLPQVAVLGDVAVPRIGLAASALVLLALQIPSGIELFGWGKRGAGALTVAGWHAFYVVWVGALTYAVFGGWVRIALLTTGDLALAGADPPLALAAVPFVLSAWGVLVRQHMWRGHVVRVPLDDLPSEWAGARVLHLSDVHVGRFLGPARLARLAARAKALRPDLVVLTGDLMDSEATLAGEAARALASIDPPLGVWACLGNHDHYAGAGRVREALEAEGIVVLVNAGRVLRRGGAPIWIAGVEDLWHGADLDAALRGRPPDHQVLLLSHQPNLFPRAAESGVALTMSGHTHGGQVAVPHFRQVSLARLVSPYVAGLYTLGRAQLYVSRGVGVIRPLVRLGAPAELPVLELQRTVKETLLAPPVTSTS